MADNYWITSINPGSIPPVTAQDQIQNIDDSVDAAVYGVAGGVDLYITDVREGTGQNQYLYLGYYMAEDMSNMTEDATGYAFFSTATFDDPIVPSNTLNEIEVLYSNEEEASLRHKFGGPELLTQEEIVSNKIQDIIQSLAQDVEISKMSGQLAYNKVDYKGFTQSEISSFAEETETATVGTTVTPTGGTTGGGY